MTGTTELLRAQALDLLQIAIAAADPKGALERAIAAHPCPVPEGGVRHLVAVGKAAVPMMAQALAQFGDDPLGQVLAVTNYENVPDQADFPLMGAAHPLPDAQGLAAGQAVIDMLTTQVGPQDCVVLLLSGGGSALLPAPSAGVSLADKSALSDQLLKSGADIGQINTVRRALSQLKGGGFAMLCPDVPLYCYMLSDVPSDTMADIASGPTVLGSRDPQAAIDILKQFDLYETAPDSIKAALAQPLPAYSRAHEPHNILIGSNRLSVAAMAKAVVSDDCQVISPWLAGPVEEAASLFVNHIEKALKEQGLQAFLCGGETSVQVQGTGRGGRNQEMALRVAALAHERGLTGRWVFLSGGTDGRDGPTDAAGGLVDAGTIPRLAAKGLEVADYLANNDSYAALSACGDLVITGGTGTNVADVQLCLVHNENNV